FDRTRCEYWFPNCTNQDARIYLLLRPPTLPVVVGTQARIGGLQRFGYGHQEPRRLRLVRLGMQVVEAPDHINPIHGSAIAVLMVAAVQDDLQFVPGGHEIFVGQRAATDSSRSIRNEG